MKKVKERVETVPINFNMRRELNERLDDLCSHRGDKGFFLNQAVAIWLEREGPRVSRFNDTIREG